MKRKPPAQNVRRVRAIAGNMRYSVVNKCLRTIQCESFQEYKLVLLLERDRTVKEYVSQPVQLTYRNTKGHEASYTPDFQVWHTDETVALHEVTVQNRRSKDTQIQREEAARTICQEHGWQYVVHTEETLPEGSELANLQLLFGFRASGMANPAIAQSILRLLFVMEKYSLLEVVRQLQLATGHSTSQVMPAILHLIWHGELQIDWHQLLFQDASPHPAACIWREVQDHG